MREGFNILFTHTVMGIAGEGFMLVLKRVYDPPEEADGTRFLVERLWPRGIKKTDLPMEDWLKDAAPSTELRHWFGHEPAKWDEFKRRYFAELDQHRDAIQPLINRARRGRVTLLYSARDLEHNNAVALKEYVQQLLSGSRH